MPPAGMGWKPLPRDVCHWQIPHSQIWLAFIGIFGYVSKNDHGRRRTYNWNPAQLEPHTAFGFHNLRIVATRANVRSAIALLLDLIWAAKYNWKTKEKVLYG